MRDLVTESRKASPDLFGLFLSAGLAVAGWKVVALMLASSGSAAGQGLGSVKVLLALVGLIFVVSGLAVLQKWPGRDTMLFAGYCLCDGLHWGGPLELPSGNLRTGLLFFYLLVSSLLGAALFLHFALSFPKTTRASNSKIARYVLYGPFVVGAVLAALAVVAPAESQTQATGQSGFLFLHTSVSNLFPALALVLYITYLVRPVLPRTEKPLIGLMVIGMLTAWLPYLVASTAGWETDPWNLTVVALPISFVIATLGIKRIRNSSGTTG